MGYHIRKTTLLPLLCKEKKIINIAQNFNQAFLCVFFILSLLNNFTKVRFGHKNSQFFDEIRKAVCKVVKVPPRSSAITHMEKTAV